MKQADSRDNSEKNAAKTERQQARMQRQNSRAEKLAGKGRSLDGTTDRHASRLCLLEKVEVRKTPEGFQVVLNSADGRRSFLVPKAEITTVLRDLETAIQVMRSQS